MKKNLTELVFILDMSGSMCGLTSDTIGGFNSMIDKQKAEEGEALVTTVLFNTRNRTIHDRVDINSVEPLTRSEYSPSGCTALLDAIGDTIHHVANIHKYAREEDVPESTIFVITTDGLENSSHRYSAERVKEMIKHEQDKYNWEFIFLAANIDTVSTAEDLGIKQSRAVSYRATEEGTEMLYDAVGCAVSMKRRNMARPAQMRDNDILENDRSWRDRLDKN